MRGKNQEEKQQEIQTHKQERSTWHVSILPAISPGVIEKEGEWNFVRKENLSSWEGFCKFILKQGTATGLTLAKDSVSWWGGLSSSFQVISDIQEYFYLMCRVRYIG
jgi:hypothetical protein